MEKIVDFIIILDDGVRKRHYHMTENGTVKYFTVQLEIKIKSKWKTIIRYDCSHGFSHIDKYDINGKQIKTKLYLNFKTALTFADWDINKNWQKHKDFFLKGDLND